LNAWGRKPVAVAPECERCFWPAIITKVKKNSKRTRQDKKTTKLETRQSADAVKANANANMNANDNANDKDSIPQRQRQHQRQQQRL
jgi:hypothetical protein